MRSYTEFEPMLSTTTSLSCNSVRLIIEQSAIHYQRTEYLHDVDDPGYDDQATEMGAVLADASDAFEKRPVDCLMTVDSDDCYGCQRCNFRADLSLSAQSSDSFD